MKEKKISIECSLSFLQCIGKDVLIYLHILWDRAVSKKNKNNNREEKVLARPPNNLISGTIADSIPLCSIIAPTIFFSFFIWIIISYWAASYMFSFITIPNYRKNE